MNVLKLSVRVAAILIMTVLLTYGSMVMGPVMHHATREGIERC